MKRFDVVDLPLPGLRLLTRAPISDDRGFFCRMYCREAFAGTGFDEPINQWHMYFQPSDSDARGRRPPPVKLADLPLPLVPVPAKQPAD